MHTTELKSCAQSLLKQMPEFLIELRAVIHLVMYEIYSACIYHTCKYVLPVILDMTRLIHPKHALR